MAKAAIDKVNYDKQVACGVTATPLHPTSKLCALVYIQALSTNTGEIVWGDDTAQHMQLPKMVIGATGENNTQRLECVDLNEIYVKGTNAADKVNVFAILRF